MSAGEEKVDLTFMVLIGYYLWASCGESCSVQKEPLVT